MKKAIPVLLKAAVLIFLITVPAFAEMIKCTECGMGSEVGSKFTSRIVQGEKILYFCDIGDLFSYLNRKKPENVRVEVKDYPTGEWIDAQKSFYVHAEKKFNSPMGWGIASFKEKTKAAEYGAVMDYDGATKSVR